MGMRPQTRHQPVLPLHTASLNVFKQRVDLHHLLYRQRASRRDSVGHLGMPVPQQTAATLDGEHNAMRGHDGGDGLVPGLQTLGECRDFGGNLLLRKQTAGAAHAAYDFVHDKQHAMGGANVADTLVIASVCGLGAQRRANNGFCNKGHDVFGTLCVDPIL